MHLMQRNEGSVLGKDEVVVPPPVVAAVPQLDHMQHALTHLASYLVLMLHPLDIKCKKIPSRSVWETTTEKKRVDVGNTVCDILELLSVSSDRSFKHFVIVIVNCHRRS